MNQNEVAAKNRKSGYPNTGEVDPAHAQVLPGVTGREDLLGADPASLAKVDIDQPVGAEPRSAVTGAHDAGMGADETEDGLSGTEEAVRRAAEDETEADDFEELPVFDRAEALPKII